MAVHRWREARLAATAGAALSVMLATACGSTAGPPDHFTRVETGWMTIDIPESWVPVEMDDDPWTEGYADAADDSATLLLALSPTFSESSTALGATSYVIGSIQIAYPGFRAVADKKETSTDYAHLNWIQFTYSGPEEQEYDGNLWGVADDSQRAVLVQLTGENLDDDLVATIGDSIKIVKE